MTDLEIYQNSFIHTLFKVTPSLRYVYLIIQRSPQKIILLNAYYAKDPSEIEKELIDDIGSGIIGMTDEFFELEIKTNITSIHFNNIEKNGYLLYARFEGLGFED